MEIFWEGWTRNYAFALIEIILHSIICVLMLSVFMVYIIVFCKDKNKSSSIEKKFEIALLISIIIGLIIVFGNYFVSCLLVLIFDLRFDNGCFYRILFSGIGLGIQRSILYVFMVYRLKIVFKDSVFELNEKVIVFLTSFIIIGGLIINVTTGYLSYIHHDFLCANSQTLVINSIISQNLDVITSVVLMSLFIYKLNQLIKLSNDIAMKRVANKFTILTIVSVTSSLISILGVALDIFPYQGVSMDLVINNVCMLLTFGVMNRYYQKLCICCLCLEEKCCLKSVMRDKAFTMIEIELASQKNSKISQTSPLSSESRN